MNVAHSYSLALVGLLALGGCRKDLRCPDIAATPRPNQAKLEADTHDAVDAGQHGRTLQVASKVLALVNARDGVTLFSMFDGALQTRVSAARATQIAQQMLDEKGPLRAITQGPKPDEFVIQCERGSYRLDLSIDQRDRINRLRFFDPPPASPPVAQSSIPLGLPLAGTAYVFWGGDTVELNYHAEHSNERRAADLDGAKVGEHTYRTDGKTNADYIIYGRQVLAVADGQVEVAVDGVPENIPGELNPEFLSGNVLLVRHTDALYSMYAHLQPARLRVKRGERVKRGQILGYVGNSGNASEPHLHFQMQDGPSFQKSFGVEPVFERVMLARDGDAILTAHYTFLRGDAISAPN